MLSCIKLSKITIYKFLQIFAVSHKKYLSRRVAEVVGQGKDCPGVGSMYKVDTTSVKIEVY